MRRIHAGAEEKCEKKAVAERNCYALTITPILHLSCVAGVCVKEPGLMKLSLVEDYERCLF